MPAANLTMHVVTRSFWPQWQASHWMDEPQLYSWPCYCCQLSFRSANRIGFCQWMWRLSQLLTPKANFDCQIHQRRIERTAKMTSIITEKLSRNICQTGVSQIIGGRCVLITRCNCNNCFAVLFGSQQSLIGNRKKDETTRLIRIHSCQRSASLRFLA